MTNNIIVFPKFEELNNEIKELKDSLCNLLSERDELTFVQCKNIEAKYMVELGSLEIALYKIQCKVLRVKRKLSLIQQKINRKEEVRDKDIETLLDEEFEQYQKELDEKLHKLNSAISYSNAECLSVEDTKELKMIYHKVVKSLHPDLHPELTSEEIELFFRAVAAYDAGDIETMRIIEKTLTDDEEFEPSKDTIKEMMAERDSLFQMVQKVKDQIDEIKTSFPYNAIELLEDKEKIAEKRLEYEQAIDQHTEIYKTYKEKIETMMGK